MKLNGYLYLVQLLLLAGSTLMLVFIILSGGVNHFPFDEFYWIQADTSAIDGAPSVTRWTFWGLASVAGDKSVRFSYGPAEPFSPVDNFGTTENIPQDFIDNRNVYFYLSRFAFAFYWIALAFVGVTLIISVFSLFSSSVVKLDSWLISLGLLFAAGGASFETAITVMGKNAFEDDGYTAKLGASLFGLAWATVAVLIILFFITWGGLISLSYKKHKLRLAAENEYSYQLQNQQAQAQYQEPATADAPAAAATAEDPYTQQNQGTLGNESGIKFFKIRRNNDAESV